MLETIQMNNAELAETLVANHAMSKSDARKAVDGIMAAIVTAASKGDEVVLAASASSKLRTAPHARAAIRRRARQYRSPHRRS